MAPNTRKLSFSLVCVVPLLLNGYVAGAPRAALPAVAAREENNLMTVTPTLTVTVNPCPLSGCGPATSTPSQDNICSAAKSSLSAESTKTYGIICDVDFPGQNIWPFLHVASFDECKSKCDEHNDQDNGSSCLGFLYAPGRVDDADDCYLKSSLNYPMAATVHLVGATIISTLSAATSTSTTSPISTTTSVIATTKPATSVQSQLGGALVLPSISSPTAIAAPAVMTVKELGASVNKPTINYVRHEPAQPMKLGTELLRASINTDLITKYPLASDTGVYAGGMSSVKTKLVVATMKTTPKLARDGGKGGMINGTHVVYFCDTAVTSGGELVSLVSSSVATDNSMKALYGNSLELVDNLGEWQDDVGRMRGFAPMTEGEEAFNTAMSGDGYRYAIWPESSPISINATHALIYASIVFDQVDMTTQHYDLSPLGNTILVIALDPVYGPSASRPVAQLFQQGQITYGSLGGFRAWGKAGPGNQDGEIYLFGQVPNGVFLAKTIPSAYTLIASYSYWNGQSWSVSIPDQNNHDALILAEPVKDFDLIYAPVYESFIMIYLTNLADNTFYYRHCQPLNIIPPYMPKGHNDWAEAIHSCNWTDRTQLYKAPTPQREFIYAGGVHAGYYGSLDITNGGHKMLISWTEKTGENASSSDAGYAHKTAYVDWGTNYVTQCPDGVNGC